SVFFLYFLSLYSFFLLSLFFIPSSLLLISFFFIARAATGLFYFFFRKKSNKKTRCLNLLAVGLVHPTAVAKSFEAAFIVFVRILLIFLVSYLLILLLLPVIRDPLLRSKHQGMRWW